MRNVGTWHESHSSPTHIQSVARESAPAPRISNYKRQARYFNDHTCTKIYITTAWDEDTYKEDIYKHCTKYDTMSMTTHILVHVQPLTVVLSFATCLRYHPERVDCMEGGGGWGLLLSFLQLKFSQNVISLNCTIIFIPWRILSSPPQVCPHIHALQVLWNSGALFHIFYPLLLFKQRLWTSCLLGNKEYNCQWICLQHLKF